MSNNKLDTYTYKQAIEELEQIVNELESENLDLDEILKKVEWATTLITYCKQKLRHSETTLEQILKKSDTNFE